MRAPYKQKEKSVDEFKDNIKERSFDKLVNDPVFFANSNVKTEFDMWAWIYSELSVIRQEVSRLGLLVRSNNEDSPNYLSLYHSHLYSLLLPVSTIIDHSTWKKIDTLWLQVKYDIESYNLIRKAIPNKRIPYELVRRLDILYRVTLLLMQKAGLGIRVSTDVDISAAIESTIVGE